MGASSALGRSHGHSAEQHIRAEAAGVNISMNYRDRTPVYVIIDKNTLYAFGPFGWTSAGRLQSRGQKGLVGQRKHLKLQRTHKKNDANVQQMHATYTLIEKVKIKAHQDLVPSSL